MNLEKLPDIVLRKIYDYCDFREKINLRCSHSTFYYIREFEDILNKILEQRFGNNWKELFERIFSLEKYPDDIKAKMQSELFIRLNYNQFEYGSTYLVYFSF